MKLDDSVHRAAFYVDVDAVVSVKRLQKRRDLGQSRTRTLNVRIDMPIVVHDV